MTQYWQELLKLLGGFAIIVSAVAWVVKSVVTHFLDRDVEEYKSQLATESAREIENLKTQLQLTAKEHEVRFSKLHEKRAEIIADLYSKLSRAHRESNILMFRIEQKEDEASLKTAADFAYKASISASGFFEGNQLYLSKELSDSIRRILSTMQLTSLSFPYDGDIRTRGLDIWKEQSQKISAIMSKLEKEFRLMLGSEKEPEK
jgi:hypothetical protein